MIEEIKQWLDSGAGVQEGLRLLDIYDPNRHLARLVSLRPERYGYLLAQSLRRVLAVNGVDAPTGFREEWPFLQNSDCPMELKILAADKITAYRNYVAHHQQLFACTTIAECFDVAKKVVQNFVENRKIISEFTYYKEHHEILGRHPIFKEVRYLAELRKMSMPELFRKKENLMKSIWRLKKQIAEKSHPHLLPDRERRLVAHEKELAEIDRLISGYAPV